MSSGTVALDQVRVNVVRVGGSNAGQQDAGMIVRIDIAISVVFPVVQFLGRLQCVLILSGFLVAAPLQVLWTTEG